MSRPGNPNWGKPAIPDPVLPTGFELQVEKLGLSPNEYQDSPKLRHRCLKNANRHYVPEALLKLWRMDVNANEEI